MIADAENVKLDDGVRSCIVFPVVLMLINRIQVVPLILDLSGGDMRKAITFMQTGQRLHSTQSPPTPITMDSGKQGQQSCLTVPDFRIDNL